jgi:hypothetical protein
MAGVLGTAQTAEVALSAGVAKTVLQVVAATNHRVLIEAFNISFDGVSPTAEPVLVEVVRQTTAGTMSALTPVKLNTADDETLQATAQHTATVEPTTTDVLFRQDIHPQTGWKEFRPLGKEWVVPGGARIAVRCTAPASVNAVAGFDFNE